MFLQLSPMLQMLWIHNECWSGQMRMQEWCPVFCLTTERFILSDIFTWPSSLQNPQMPDSPASKIYKYSQTSFKWIPHPRRMPRCPYCSYRIPWYQTRSGAATTVWQGGQLLLLIPRALDRCFRNRWHNGQNPLT